MAVASDSGRGIAIYLGRLNAPLPQYRPWALTLHSHTLLWRGGRSPSASNTPVIKFIITDTKYYPSNVIFLSLPLIILGLVQQRDQPFPETPTMSESKDPEYLSRPHTCSVTHAVLAARQACYYIYRADMRPCIQRYINAPICACPDDLPAALSFHSPGRPFPSRARRNSGMFLIDWSPRLDGASVGEGRRFPARRGAFGCLVRQSVEAPDYLSSDPSRRLISLYREKWGPV
ncbi:hypothetical protein J6590_041857 [Homalodisca vitripennis]|nr:hypothetical protein J6590_041857 [Homalodisca vitripennis]